VDALTELWHGGVLKVVAGFDRLPRYEKGPLEFFYSNTNSCLVLSIDHDLNVSRKL